MYVNLVSAIVGGLLFFVFLFVVKVGPLPSILVSILGYISLNLIMSPKKNSQENKNTVRGMSSNDVEAIVKEGKFKVKSIKRYAHKINNQKVTNEINEICEVGHKILDGLKKDPKDIRVAKKFLNYYLDSTVYLVEKYVEISSTGLDSDEIVQRLNKMEGMLDMIKDTFLKQYERLIDNDLISIDAELDLLEKTIKMESL